MKTAASSQEEPLKIVKKGNMIWFGHVTRSEGMAKTILQGLAPVKRGRERSRRPWIDDIREWT